MMQSVLDAPAHGGLPPWAFFVLTLARMSGAGCNFSQLYHRFLPRSATGRPEAGDVGLRLSASVALACCGHCCSEPEPRLSVAPTPAKGFDPPAAAL